MNLNTKRFEGLLISCFNCLIGLVFLLMIFYLTRMSKIKLLEYDVSTVTAADYTVEYNVPPEVFHDFVSQHYNPEDGTKADGFKKFIKEEFENRVSAEKAVFKETNDIRIANIFFAFDNPKLMKLLMERGKYIISEEQDKEDELDEKIDNLKNDERESFIVPVTAFITFETQEGYERALRFEGTRKWCKVVADHEFMNKPLIFQAAVEPTNIIWENRHFTQNEQFWRTVIVRAIVVAIMVGVFILFFVLKIQVAENNQKYPPVDCERQLEVYGTYDNMKYYAFFEWYQMYDIKTIQKLSGSLQCWCKNLQSTEGFFAPNSYTGS